MSPEEQFIESHFQGSYSTNSKGSFVVEISLVKPKPELDNYRPSAISCLLTVGRKFKENPEFEKQYKDFIYEYKQLGHMELITQNDINNYKNEQYFLPSYAVIKPSSTTTKLKVVFEAPCKTSNGKSFNSILNVGPNLQLDIFKILLNFQFLKIIFSSDKEKVYCQILIPDEDQNY